MLLLTAPPEVVVSTFNYVVVSNRPIRTASFDDYECNLSSQALIRTIGICNCFLHSMVIWLNRSIGPQQSLFEMIVKSQSTMIRFDQFNRGINSIVEPIQSWNQFNRGTNSIVEPIQFVESIQSWNQFNRTMNCNIH